MSATLILYTTDGCHLCEQAAIMLDDLQQRRPITVQQIDIADDESLVEQYGIRIPVVKNAADNREVGWPFSVTELFNLL